MSRNLLKAGHDLIVYNRTRSRVEEMQSLGARVADTVSEAAVGVEALITMLADDRAVQDVIFESGRVSNLGVLSIRYRRERSISQ